MEGSVAGQAQSGGGQAQGDAQQQQAQPPAQGADLAALASELQQMRGTQEELRQFLLSSPALQPQNQESQPEPEPELEPLDLSFLDPADPGFDPQQAAEQLSGVIEQAAAQRAEALVRPLVDRLDQIDAQRAEDRRTQEAIQLAAEFPELEDQQVAEQVVGAARQIADASGHPELAKEPWLWRLVYMAGRAAEAHAAEAAQHDGAGGVPQAAHLEGGAGARPAGSQVDMAEQILAGGRRGRAVLPF